MNLDEFLPRFHLQQRQCREPDYPLRQPGRSAAVLIPLVNRADGLNVLLTQRARHLKHHPGQVSFPGGAANDSDPDLKYTALRETHEELGLRPTQVEVIGQLSSYRTISRYEVSPFVGLVSHPFTLVPDTNEVETVFEVPLAFVIDHANHDVYYIQRSGTRFPVYAMVWQEHVIWGATAAILRNLSHQLSK